MITREELEAVSPLAWMNEHNFVTENQKPMEFIKHRFLVQPFNDLHPKQVIMKSAQVGWSVLKNFQAVWIMSQLKYNIIYVLPTKNVVNDFVAPKVDPIINSNPDIAALIGKDSVSQKRVGDRFIYYKGAFSERDAISISGDVLIVDELDRCLDMGIITTYKSRLQASDVGWEWYFSNPSLPNFGVHEKFLESDQHHWLVTCHECGYEMMMEFFKVEVELPTGKWPVHYIDQERACYACGKCDAELSDKDRMLGRWQAIYPEREWRGYHVSQMVAPWVPASYLINSYRKDSPEFFHNFVLGLPYIEADILIDRAALLNATAPQKLAMRDVVMGTDNGVEKHWVIGTPNGVTKYGKTESWEELEQMFLMYDMKAWVIDANPYPTEPRRLAKKYPGRVFLNYYVQDRNNMGIIRWGHGDDAAIVQSDRTKILDYVAMQIRNTDLIFAMNVSEMEGMIEHWMNMYRIIEENNAGIPKSKWVTKENRPDHWAHALVYFRIALNKTLEAGGTVARSRGPGPDKGKAPVVIDGAIEGIDLTEAIRSTSNTTRKRGYK